MNKSDMSLRFVADENFNQPILDTLVRQKPDLDIVRVQDIGLKSADDPAILEWAAQQGRILLTHDARTMIGYAYERVQAGLPMPGVLEIKPTAPIAATTDDIILLAECGSEDELEGQVRYLPLK